MRSAADPAGRVVLGARRPGVEGEPQGIVAERVVQPVDEAGIRPVEAEPGEFDQSRLPGPSLSLRI